VTRPIRSFVAIPVTGYAADRLTALARAFSEGRPVPPENLHLTLAFLGDQPVEALEELDHALSAIRLLSFDLSTTGIELLGPRNEALTIGVVPSLSLNELHTRIHRALRQTRIATERRRFRPHVTIARLRTPPGSDPRRSVSEPPTPATLPATGFALYRSTLRPSGAVHEILADYPLTAG
jgi:2'-5' RNA ligase